MGKGQVRERNRKTLEGGDITQREELKSNRQHMRAQFQNKTEDKRTTKNRIMLRNVVGLC